MATATKNRGWIVALAGAGINLALGVLYAWSIFKGAIEQQIGLVGGFDWDPASLNDPYALCCLVFALMMVPAGRFQDRYGPRLAAMTGGLLVGLGFILSAMSNSYPAWLFGFGVLAGTGIACGYAAATPAALKWFPPRSSGQIAGIVVAGFGLASVYIAPLTQYLLAHYGLQQAMFFYGIALPVMVGGLAMLLANPPVTHQPPGLVERRKTCQDGQQKRALIPDTETGPAGVLVSPIFWVLWLLYFIGAGAGLMVIGSIAGMAKASLGANAFLAVAILAVGNAGGRVAAGILSDRIGRKKTLSILFAVQAGLMFAAAALIRPGAAAPVILLLATGIGFNYGANLAIFPSYAKDLWGMKNFGVNYGILFTAWGIGGLLLSRAAQSLEVASGGYRSSFILAGMILSLAGLGAFLIRDRKEELRRRIKAEMLLAATIASPQKNG